MEKLENISPCQTHPKDVNSDYDKASQRYNESTVSIELQTAPVRDGVLPGVLRQVILDICSREKIPVREIAPSWSEREMWLEAFITNSLRLIQHVEVIQAPSSWDSLEAKTWRDVKWEEKLFEHAPGRITMLIEVIKAFHLIEITCLISVPFLILLYINPPTTLTCLIVN
ncbi:uncharacterized protein LOC107858563 [Capsicum annuum]|uniref:uncharacterized protein LOC107858563 n=1 Tax=Capsicum annuum TaxID=4072 RepID=UPI001FB06B14|nr:uncharacterized protein LOC107858563 [Capsicum annuum]